MLRLFDWLDGESKFSLNEKLLHIADDYYSKSQYLKNELSCMKYLYYFN